MTSHSKEDLERTRLSNKLDDYGNSFSRKSFFKLTFDSYIDIVKIINSLFDSENYELAYQVMDMERFCLWDMFPEWQSTKKVAKIFGVSEKTLREWKKQGHIRHSIKLVKDVHWRLKKNKRLFVQEDLKNSWPYSERGKKIQEEIETESLTKDLERYLKLYASYALKDT